MKAQQLRDKDDKALRKELSALHHEAFKLRMQQGTGQLGRPSEIKRVRRDIARVKTIQEERTRMGEKE